MIAVWLMLSGAAFAESPSAAEAKSLLGATMDSGSTTAPTGPWWKRFDDPKLSGLIQEGLRHNPQVASTDAQARMAQAGKGQALSGLLPSLTIELQGQHMPTDGIGLSPFTSQMPDYGAAFEGLAEMMAGLAEMTGQDPSTLPSFETERTELPDTYSQGSAMLVATLPIDIVGRQTHTYLASRKSAAAANADHAAQRLSTTLRIADGWYDLVAARAQHQIVLDQQKANKDMLDLINLRYEGGEANALDVLQQKQQLAVVEAVLPRAHAQIALAETALRSALGKPPEAGLPDGTTLPQVGAAPPQPNRDTLVTHRPDLAGAIARLDAARYQRTAAWLSLAPTVGLTASAGRQFLHMDETDHVDSWSVGAAMSIPLFLGGRTHAGIKNATAQRDLAQAQLRARVLMVAQEIQTATADDTASAKALIAAQDRSKAAKAAFQESRARYLEGVITYLNVLTALGAHQTAELALLDAQRSRLRARVRLHGAMGGPHATTPMTEDSQ